MEIELLVNLSSLLLLVFVHFGGFLFCYSGLCNLGVIIEKFGDPLSIFCKLQFLFAISLMNHKVALSSTVLEDG